MDFLSKKIIAAIDRLREEITSLRNSIDSSRDEQQRQREQEHTGRILLSPSLRVEAETHERPDSEIEQRTYRNSSLRAQWITAIATSAAFVAAAIYAGIAARQLRQTAEAIREANRAATAAEKANTDANTRFVADERPYMWVAQPTNEIGRGTNGLLSWNVHYKNFGKTPALHVRVRFFLATGQGAMNRVREIPQIPLSEGADIEPPNGAPSFASAELHKSVSDADINALYHIDNGIVVYGRIDYSGRDGTEYWSLFCMGRQTNLGVDWCKSHSELH